MKFSLLKLMTVILFGLSLIVTAPAFAANKHYSNRHDKGYWHGNQHHNKHSYGRHRHHRSHHKTGHIIGGIVGGVILGNIIHNAARHSHSKTYSNYNNDRQYYKYNSNVTINSTPPTTYRVLNGNECYLVNINKLGHEILTQVPNLNCGF